MDSLQSFIYNIYSKYSPYNNDKLLEYSINAQISKLNSKIKEIDSLILKKKDEMSLYEKNFNENEIAYNNSKQKVIDFNKNINNKLVLLKKDLDIIFNNDSDICNKINLLNNNFNKFQNINDSNIIDIYSNLNSNIEKNVLKCEISKEKLNSIIDELTKLQTEKENYSKKIGKLTDVK